jgi:lysophospholipase L1-like esterase
MLECLILGDSIAVGTQQIRHECALVGRSGINSWQWNKSYAKDLQPAKTVVISLGSNDHSGVHTFKELMNMRQRVDAERVYWILPAGNLKAGGIDIKDIQAIVEIIAKNYNDIIVPIAKIEKDGIHPSNAGYKEIAAATR